jgi:hypothetical protein
MYLFLEKIMQKLLKTLISISHKYLILITTFYYSYYYSY